MNKRMVFRVDNKAHFLQCYHFIYFLVGISCIPLLLHLEYGHEALYISYIAASVWLSILLIPQAYLHHQYWKLNRHSVLEIFTQEFRIHYFDDRRDITFYSDDIVEMKTVMSYAKNDSAPRWWPTDSYSHSAIKLKSGERIIVTSLLLPECEWPISIPEKRDIKFYCAVSG